MSNKIKWKWIAQDEDGAIGKYSVFPDLRKKGWYAEENEFALIESGFSYHVNGWEGSLINLETHDYKIVNRVLIRVDKMEETKWNWIAQDKDGKIYKYDSRPSEWSAVFMPQGGDQCELIQRSIEGLTKHDWKESLINLETHDYKIVDGILIRMDKEDKQQDSTETIADKAKKIVFGDREQTYCDPGKNLRMIAGMWSAYLGIEITPEQVCDMMVQLKIVRLKSSPDHEDSKVDIIGYTLLKERLK